MSCSLPWWIQGVGRIWFAQAAALGETVRTATLRHPEGRRPPYSAIITDRRCASPSITHGDRYSVDPLIYQLRFLTHDPRTGLQIQPVETAQDHLERELAHRRGSDPPTVRLLGAPACR